MFGSLLSLILPPLSTAGMIFIYILPLLLVTMRNRPTIESKCTKVLTVITFSLILMDLHSQILLLLLLNSSTCMQERFKRVVNGEPFNGRPTTYHAIRYYGASGTAHGYAIWGIGPFKGLALEGILKCSGSVIAPVIFQTACHCVATFDLEAERFIKPPIVLHHWENRNVVYLGTSNRYGENSMLTWSSILSKQFIIHRKCGQLQGGELYTYDFAIIRLEDEWIKSDRRRPFPWLEIIWAPVYTSKEIDDFHAYALQEQLVCLHLGFGYYNRYIPEISGILRHGWAVLIPQMECVDKTATPKLKKQVTWVCSQNFTKHDQEAGAGDSGGPLTCNDRHLGFVSGFTWELARNNKLVDIVTYYTALIYDLWVNAAEYRRSLYDNIYRLKDTYNGSNRLLPEQREYPKLSYNLVHESRVSEFQASRTFQTYSNCSTALFLLVMLYVIK